MIKGSIKEEDTTSASIYAPNIGASQHVRQILTSMKGEINGNTITVEDFNAPLTKQKISKETQALNDTVDQLDLIDICISPKTMDFSPFSSAYRTDRSHPGLYI